MTKIKNYYTQLLILSCMICNNVLPFALWTSFSLSDKQKLVLTTGAVAIFGISSFMVGRYSKDTTISEENQNKLAIVKNISLADLKAVEKMTNEKIIDKYSVSAVLEILKARNDVITNKPSIYVKYDFITQDKNNKMLCTLIGCEQKNTNDLLFSTKDSFVELKFATESNNNNNGKKNTEKQNSTKNKSTSNKKKILDSK